MVELIVAPGDEGAGSTLLALVAERARQAGCAQIQCWMLRHHRFYVGLLERGGFVYWPRRAGPGWLRYATPFIVRPGPGRGPAPDAPCLQNWFIAMGDHHYY